MHKIHQDNSFSSFHCKHKFVSYCCKVSKHRIISLKEQLNSLFCRVCVWYPTVLVTNVVFFVNPYILMKASI